ncbi:MAG: hypothetical protein HUU35_19275, partial [Armatimonadetes bacterium]|nr:hypothetical protein [Armatimonadota bacterium]
MRLRYLCLLAWLVVTTDPRPAPAALLDTLAGSSRVDLGLVPEPTDGLVPRRALVPDPSPGLTWRVQNEFPLHLRRGGREVGELSSMSQSWLADGRAGSGRWRAEAVLYQASGGFDRDRAPTQGDLSESTVQLGYELPLGHAWRLATGYRYGRERGAVITADPDLRPSSSGLFEATRFSHRLSLGAQRQLGAVSLGAGAAWLINDARMDTALRNIPAQVLLDQQGWQAAANAGLAVGRDWQIAVAGGYREVRNRDTVFVGGVQHGRAWPAAEEWRLGLEATGDLGPRLRWWGTLFHRDLR